MISFRGEISINNREFEKNEEGFKKAKKCFDQALEKEAELVNQVKNIEDANVVFTPSPGKITNRSLANTSIGLTGFTFTDPCKGITETTRDFVKRILESVIKYYNEDKAILKGKGPLHWGGGTDKKN